MKQEQEKCCGNCCWMVGEDIYGQGMCAKIFAELVNSGDKCHEDHFVSHEEMRHYIAVLIQHNRWRRDRLHHRQQDPKEIGKAIDFAVKYIKTFMEL